MTFGILGTSHLNARSGVDALLDAANQVAAELDRLRRENAELRAERDTWRAKAET
jgi:hypothetical protein